MYVYAQRHWLSQLVISFSAILVPAENATSSGLFIRKCETHRIFIIRKRENNTFFPKTANGWIQQVAAKDKSDTAQIQLIRDHLSEIIAIPEK